MVVDRIGVQARYVQSIARRCVGEFTSRMFRSKPCHSIVNIYRLGRGEGLCHQQVLSPRDGISCKTDTV
jgi:hypothetical protein